MELLKAMQKELCEILGGERVFDKSIRFTGPGGSRGSMTVSGGSVTLELGSLSFKAAQKLARSLIFDRDKELARQREAQ